MEQEHMGNLLKKGAVRLATALNEVAGERVAYYESAELDNPRTKWVLESYGNWKELYGFLILLSDEYTHAFNEEHIVRGVMERLSVTSMKYAGQFPAQATTEYIGLKEKQDD